MGLVISCSFVLVLLVVAFFFISMFIGGADETKNASSAGALNLGKHIITNEEFKVNAGKFSVGSQYQDVLDKTGRVGIANINSIWGKALLAEANAQEMHEQGLDGNSKVHADMMFSAANQINTELVDKLTDSKLQVPIFEQMATQNSVRMLGNTKVQATKGGYWRSSMMERGEVSNLEVPDEAVMPTNSLYSSLKLKDQRIPGYTPLDLNGHKFCFVAFADKEKTHLVSKSEFDGNMSSAKKINSEWSKPVPNAFSCEGEASNQQQYKEKALAFVVSNPQKLYKLSMPHGFLHIQLEDNTCTWLMNSLTPPVDEAAKKLVGGAPDKVNGAQKKLDAVNPDHFKQDKNGDGEPDALKAALEKHDGTYPFRPDLQSKTGSPISAGCGTLMGTNIPLGKEYLPPCLDSALFGSKIDTGEYEYLETIMVNRINQMLSVPGKKFSKKDLHSLLKDPETAGWMQSKIHDYYIFSPDGAKIEVSIKEKAILKCSWLAAIIDHEPDGGEANRAHLSSFFPLIPMTQVRMIPDPFCGPYVPPFGMLYVQINDKWKPGSGYDGCLGKITSKHHTDIYLYGICGPL